MVLTICVFHSKLSTLVLVGVLLNSNEDAATPLRSCHNIHHLHLDIKPPHNSPPVYAIRPPIHFPRLEDLTLFLLDYSPILLTSFDAPTLRRLKLMGEHYPPSDHRVPEMADIASYPSRFPILSELRLENISSLDSGVKAGAVYRRSRLNWFVPIPNRSFLSIYSRRRNICPATTTGVRTSSIELLASDQAMVIL